MVKENYFAQAKRERIVWLGSYVAQVIEASDSHGVSYGKVLDTGIMKFGLTEKKIRDDLDLIIRVNNYVLKEGLLKKAEVIADGTPS